ncbi:MAG: Rpn family recombination-promoting nuclease/putative transposase, partial [Bacteroidota bacterium]
MRYLDPKNDLTFKKVFGQHPHLLKSFLNALLPLEAGQEIVELEYLPAELVPEIPFLKHSIVDVRCQDNRGRQFIVEMQMLWTDTFKYRVLFNASKAYVKQLDRGYEYKGLQPVYALGLVNATFETDTDLHYHHYRMIHHAITEKQIEGLELIFVELPKFKAKSLTEKKLQVLWLRYLTEIEDQTEDLPADLLEVPEIREAIEILQESAFTKGELLAYDSYWDSVSSEKTLISDAEQKGLTRGRQEGLQLALKIARLHQSGRSLAQIATAV